jgi:hypothetical protein
MDVRAFGWPSLVLLLAALPASAQELSWRPSKTAIAASTPAGADAVVLCRPTPLADSDVAPRPTIVRAQLPDVPPPPPPGAAVPGPPPGIAGPTPYNCGQVNSNGDLGFWGRFGQHLKQCWTDTTGGVGGMFATGQGQTPFQSDHTLDFFASPVTNPFYTQDPRALTQFKGLFLWQHTPTSNSTFDGGNNYFGGFQGSVAFTPWLSLIVDKVGWTWLNPRAGAAAGVPAGNGFSEVHLGPQVTFIRDCNSGTAAAFGLIFEVPIGSASVAQDTGTLSLRPYFSFAQHFGKFQYGSFNFMNTTGYDLAVDSQRNDFLFSNFHLDYDVMDRHLWYPLVELNWILYPYNGGARSLDFGGGDLYNFGSTAVNGHQELSLALGFRYKPYEWLQFGLAGQMNVLGNSSGRHLDLFRLTADVIFRY